jgi:hypothetical protein
MVWIFIDIDPIHWIRSRTGRERKLLGCVSANRANMVHAEGARCHRSMRRTDMPL